MRGFRRRHQGWSAVVALALVAAGCSGAEPAADDWSSGDATRPVHLEPLPPAMPLSGTLTEQAAEVATAFRAGGEERLAATVAAFAAAGVPILDPEGISLTTDPADFVGVPWFAVVAAAGASTPGTGVTLGDLVTGFGADGVEPAPDRDAMGADLLGALRQGVSVDSDPRLQFVAELVQFEARESGATEITGPDVTADQVKISVPTAFLLSSLGIRTAILELVRLQDQGPGRAFANDGPVIGPPVNGPGPVSQIPAGCATDSAGGWAIWLVSKVSTGVSIPGFDAFSGAYSTLVEHLINNHGAVELTGLGDKITKAGSIAGWASAVLSITTLMAAILTLSSEADLEKGEPLVRTQTRTAGKDDLIIVKVFYDYGKVDQSTLDALNCILSLLSLVGNNSTLPSGAAAGVEVTVDGRRGYGFADRLDESQATVRFAGLSVYERVQTASDKGTVTVPIQGREQKRDLRTPTPSPDEKTFIIDVSSTIDPVDASTLSKHFLDGLVCAGGVLAGKAKEAALGCVDSFGNILKGFEWNVGAWQFKLTDWVQCSVPTEKVPTFAGGQCTADSSISYKVTDHATVDLTSPPWTAATQTWDGSYTVSVDARLRRVDESWVDNGSTYSVSGSINGVQTLTAEGVDCHGTSTETYSGGGPARVSFSPDASLGIGTLGIGGVEAVVDVVVTASGSVTNPYGGEDLACDGMGGIIGVTGTSTTQKSISMDCGSTSSNEIPYDEEAKSIDVSCTYTADSGYGTRTYTRSGTVPLP